MNIHVEINPSRVDCQQLRALLIDCGWGIANDYTDAILEKMIKGCSYFVVAHETTHLLGYARAFSDDIAVTWIAEILVHPERRRQGIGTHIMNELVRVADHTAIYAETFLGTEGFFEPFGIRKKNTLVACSRKPFTR